MFVNTPSRAVLALLCFALPTVAHARQPRFQRGPNVSQCQRYSWKPHAKSIPGGRAANDRVPFMTNSIHKYLEKLNAKGCGLTVQSTFRDCVTNSSVGGAQKSRHLCGAGADTAGCSKPIASRTCRESGLTYIEEGSGRFPHCQIDTFCDGINRQREDGDVASNPPPAPPPPPPHEEETTPPPPPPSQAGACHYAIFACTKSQATATSERDRISSELTVVHTDDVTNFNRGWYCVVNGPGTNEQAKAALQKYRARTPGYVKKGC